MKKILLSQRGLSVLGAFKGISTAVCVIYCVILMGSAVGPYSETIDETTFIKGSVIIFGAFVLQTLISIAHGRRVDRQSIAEQYATVNHGRYGQKSLFFSRRSRPGLC